MTNDVREKTRASAKMAGDSDVTIGQNLFLSFLHSFPLPKVSAPFPSTPSPSPVIISLEGIEKTFIFSLHYSSTVFQTLKIQHQASKHQRKQDPKQWRRMNSRSFRTAQTSRSAPKIAPRSHPRWLPATGTFKSEQKLHP